MSEHSHLNALPLQDGSQEDGSHDFLARHIGTTDDDQAHMLKLLGYQSRAALIDAVIPPSIRRDKPLATGAAMSENAALDKLRALASQNKVLRSLIGQGYYGTYTPSVILRNVLENPAWYTAYTPYQPEISQGRLEAIINFQTMVTDLTGMDIANASMLDEATAAAEAMTLCQRSRSSASRIMFVADDVLPQTIEVIKTRAEPLGVEVVVGPAAEAVKSDCFAVLLQYPGVDGRVVDYTDLAGALHDKKVMLIVAADLLALTLLKPPGQWGADVVVGNSQRFGVPLGFGGPHAAFLATRDAFKRNMPGRLVGVTQDANGDPAYRLALQTREQHIRREKATSNICTAQVLLAVMASMYAVYHGPAGLKAIAQRVHRHAARLAAALDAAGLTRLNATFFDTLTIATGADTSACHARARAAGFNLREIDASTLGISFDETISEHDVEVLIGVFAAASKPLAGGSTGAMTFPAALIRNTPYLSHPVFGRYHSETEMMRYLRRLADKDIALDRAMIPLGSCTMKLNAASEMLPVTWPEIANIHPYAPHEQTIGYRAMIDSLESMLCEATGYAGVSLQPNAGSQGEYAGLLMIRAYHRSRGEAHRDICLIPASAHGTNPASAQMAGLRVVVVACDTDGNVDLADLTARAAEHAARLAAIMITYPSTHGVFEAEVERICSIVHGYGAQVYIDGANMNALVGTAAPGHFGGDVSHLNLHKTFCIPHGGGGPGVGPVAVAKHLVEFLPNHGAAGVQRSENGISAISAAPYGSAAILPISWMYIAMMGGDGLTAATQSAILAANYVARRLEPHFPVLYKGASGLVAHECILDLRPLKDSSGVQVEDVAKRLIDYGFHAPTMSFPVAGTLMIEPTESESLRELDRFIDAMIAIREEIRAVEEGRLPRDDNPLKHAPHTALVVSADEWHHAYPRSMAGYPLPSLRDNKYWPPVGRADNVYGDRNLFCSCIPIDEDVSIASRGQRMTVSVFDLFKIGIGPSSSHTVGPMRAAARFAKAACDAACASSIKRVRAELYGSLGATGKGHGSDRAVMLGLEGAHADTVDPAQIGPRVAAISSEGRLKLAGQREVAFDARADLLFLRKSLPFHPNGMRFAALDAAGSELFAQVYYSVGGGFVVEESELTRLAPLTDSVSQPYPFHSGDELLAQCKRHNLSISALMMANECATCAESEVRSRLLVIWQVMQDCVKAGCRNEGTMPGGLRIARRAPHMYRTLSENPEAGLRDPLVVLDWVNLYALAVNEENAVGGRVVTAPTNGAAGIVPAVLHYYTRFVPGANHDGVVRFLLTAAAIGMLYKENASISGAEVGCQGEVGVACSMAAAALCEVQGGSVEQVENAAEIGMEHNLGLTCDPVGGLVQVPCIERNAMGSIKAINAARIALKGDGTHFVSLDRVIKTMRDTGADMKLKYKETSRGGLALNASFVPVNVIEC